MKNKIIIPVVACVLLAGCSAHFRYPGWEDVTIANSVENKPCVKLGAREVCRDDSKEECDDFFKQRAIVMHSNTTIITGNTGIYFQCHAGNPLYKKPVFNRAEYGTNLNVITGQAFSTQRGGTVVTCAGNAVEMHPATEYFNDIFEIVSNSNLRPAYDFSSEEQKFLKTSQCDAQGNFEFRDVPAGKWVITVNVSWDVGFTRYNGLYYYTDMQKQGGYLSKEVTVKDGEVNKFIISY